MEQENAATGETGQTSWIATGLKIEESQLVLFLFPVEDNCTLKTLQKN